MLNMGLCGSLWGIKGGMAMFLGNYQHALDEKSRLTIPSRFRENLGSRFIATAGLDRAIFIYTLTEWAKLEEQLRKLPMTNSEARAFNRLFFSNASECEPDRQGRILLTPQLKNHAFIEKDTVILGVSNRVEIWSYDVWMKYQEEATKVYEETAEHLERLLPSV